jgi:hypothetical protein
VLSQSLVQSSAAFDLGTNFANEDLQSGVAFAARQDVKSLQQGHACVKQGGELARELGDVSCGHVGLGVELKPMWQIELTLDPRDPNALLFELITDVFGTLRVNCSVLQITFAVNAAPSEAAFSHGGSAP